MTLYVFRRIWPSSKAVSPFKFNIYCHNGHRYTYIIVVSLSLCLQRHKTRAYMLLFRAYNAFRVYAHELYTYKYISTGKYTYICNLLHGCGLCTNGITAICISLTFIYCLKNIKHKIIVTKTLSKCENASIKVLHPYTTYKYISSRRKNYQKIEWEWKICCKQ